MVAISNWMNRCPTRIDSHKLPVLRDYLTSSSARGEARALTLVPNHSQSRAPPEGTEEQFDPGGCSARFIGLHQEDVHIVKSA